MQDASDRRVRLKNPHHATQDSDLIAALTNMNLNLGGEALGVNLGVLDRDRHYQDLTAHSTHQWEHSSGKRFDHERRSRRQPTLASDIERVKMCEAMRNAKVIQERAEARAKEEAMVAEAKQRAAELDPRTRAMARARRIAAAAKVDAMSTETDSVSGFDRDDPLQGRGYERYRPAVEKYSWEVKGMADRAKV